MSIKIYLNEHLNQHTHTRMLTRSLFSLSFRLLFSLYSANTGKHCKCRNRIFPHLYATENKTKTKTKSSYFLISMFAACVYTKHMS